MTKRAMRVLTVGMFILLVLNSCKNNDDVDCSTVIPGCSCAYIGIVDQEGNSLLGPDNVYKPSEISLSNEGQIIELIPDDLGGTTLYLKFFLQEVAANENYLLQLNATETDVVNMDVEVMTDACFTTYNLQRFRLNEIELEVNGDIILIEK